MVKQLFLKIFAHLIAIPTEHVFLQFHWHFPKFIQKSYLSKGLSVTECV